MNCLMWQSGGNSFDNLTELLLISKCIFVFTLNFPKCFLRDKKERIKLFSSFYTLKHCMLFKIISMCMFDF